MEEPTNTNDSYIAQTYASSKAQALHLFLEEAYSHIFCSYLPTTNHAVPVSPPGDFQNEHATCPLTHNCS